MHSMFRHVWCADMALYTNDSGILWPGITTSTNMTELVWTVKFIIMTLWAYVFHPVQNVHMFTYFFLHVHFISTTVNRSFYRHLLHQYFTMSFHLTFCSSVISNSIHNFLHFISIAWKDCIADKIIYNLI